MEITSVSWIIQRSKDRTTNLKQIQITFTVEQTYAWKI